MILADANVWMDHLRRPEPALDALLIDDQILMHPFVLGEIALGSISGRERVLGELQELLGAVVVPHLEVHLMIESERLFGRGIGFVDVHLLASTRSTPDCLLWTRDKRLRIAAREFGIAADMA